MVARDFSPWKDEERYPLLFSARRAHDGSQGLQSLEGGTAKPSPIFRPEGGRSVMRVRRRPSGPNNNKEE